MAEETPSKPEVATPTEPFPRQLHGWKWAAAYVSMLSTTFLFALDNTIVADLQPSIIEVFGQIELLPWIGVGFALGASFILPWGSMYGVFNIKWVYLFNILLFEAGSAVCGAAPNMTVLIIARVIAGIGGSGMYSGTMTYVSLLTTSEERAMYMSGNAVLWGIGSVLGPVVGGAFAVSSATWRWAFYINLVIGAVFAPAYLLLVPSIEPRPGKTFKQKLGMIDWAMTVVFLAGSTCLIVAISFGGTVYAWNSGAEIALWVLAGSLFIGTCVLAKYHPGVPKENRLYPVHFLKRPILVNLQLQIFLSSGIALNMTYYIPLFFQFIRGDGPLDAGVRLLPYIVSLVVFSLLNGALMPKLSYMAPWYIGGSALCVVGSGLMCTINASTPTANIYGYSILIGSGAGCYIVAGFAIVQSLVPVEDIPNAVGAMTISQDLGMVLFLSISGTLYQNIAMQKVAKALVSTSDAEIVDLIAGTHSRAYQSLSESDKTILIPEVTEAMRSVWVLFVTGAAVSFLLSLFLSRAKLANTSREGTTGGG